MLVYVLRLRPKSFEHTIIGKKDRKKKSKNCKRKEMSARERERKRKISTARRTGR